jgi:hypothetical protein
LVLSGDIPATQRAFIDCSSIADILLDVPVGESPFSAKVCPKLKAGTPKEPLLSGFFGA